MNPLADRIQYLTESQTIAMARRSRELQAAGQDIISLSLGEPDFNTFDFIKEAAKKAIDENFSFYSPVPGYLDLRQAISKKLKRDNELDYSPEQIVVSTGAKQCIANAILCTVNPGDEVLLVVPYWVSYIEMIKLAEGNPVMIETDVKSNYKMLPHQLEQAITSKTKLLIFNSPCNPTGTVYSKEELKALAEVIRKHDLYVISDEIYEKINFIGQHASIAQFDAIKERVILINGLSKSYAMTGWRVGYLAANLTIANACNKIQGQFTSGTCSISQQAAKAAMLAPSLVTDEMNKVFKERRDIVVDMLNKIPGFITNYPEGAFYVFPDISYYFGKSDGKTTIHNDTDLCMYLLSEAYVALVPGEAFGAPSCIRFSYSVSSEKLKEAINRIRLALEKLH